MLCQGPFVVFSLYKELHSCLGGYIPIIIYDVRLFFDVFYICAFTVILYISLPGPRVLSWPHLGLVEVALDVHQKVLGEDLMFIAQDSLRFIAEPSDGQRSFIAHILPLDAQ